MNHEEHFRQQPGAPAHFPVMPGQMHQMPMHHMGGHHIPDMNIHHRLNRLETEVTRLNRQLTRLERRVDRLESGGHGIPGHFGHPMREWFE